MIPGKTGLPTQLEVWNGIRERNVQLIELQIRNFANRFRGEELQERFSKQIASLQDFLREKGYRPGKLQPLTLQAIPRELYLLMGIGLLSFTLIFMRFFIRVRPFLLPLLLLTGSGVLYLLLRGNQILTVQALSLWTALLFSLYPVLKFFFSSSTGKKDVKRRRKRAGSGGKLCKFASVYLRGSSRAGRLKLGCFTFLISAGGLLLHGFLTLPPFFSGLEFFRGVKIMYALPLILALVVALASCGAIPRHTPPAGGGGRGILRLLPSGEFGRVSTVFIRGILRRPLVMADLLVMGILLLTAYFYLPRTAMWRYYPRGDPGPRLLEPLSSGQPRLKDSLVIPWRLWGSISWRSREKRFAFRHISCLLPEPWHLYL